MAKNGHQTGFRALAILAAAVALLATPWRLSAATATALVSATVLGPAETEIAAGAVTVSNVSQPESGRIFVAKAGRTIRLSEARSLSTFRIAGGYSATYAVALPETVTLKSGAAELPVSGFGPNGASGLLARDGTATFRVSASITIPAGQAPGDYVGTYPVTVVYN